MRLSIIVPVFNELRTLEKVLQRIKHTQLQAGIEKEIIVVDDFSIDGTRDLIQKLKDEYKLKVILQDKNRGKGAAIRAGLKAVSGDFAIIQDADLEYDPNEYAQLLSPIVDRKTEVVYGSRFLGKRQIDLFSLNYFANRVLTIISNFFTGFRLTDMETCYKVFSQKALQKIAPILQSDRFDIEPEITAMVARYGFSIIERPISYKPRTINEGKKIKWRDGISAIRSIVKFGLPGLWGRRTWLLSLILSLTTLAILFGIFLGPNILGDTPSYLQAIEVLSGSKISSDFVPNRILTSFLGLQSIGVISNITGSVLSAWFLLNLFLYFIGCLFFFKLLVRMFEDQRLAYIGSMFLAANYAFLTFGMNYLMDIGGWTFYILSLYFLWKYGQTKKTTDILLSASMIGVGALFKEYAFLSAVAIAIFLIIENHRDIKVLLKRAFQTALVALIPSVLLYIYVYSRFGYTYLDWFSFNSRYYIYPSRIVEYIKAFGSLVNVLALLFIAGLYGIYKGWKEVETRKKVFLLSVFLSILPIFLWPAITQRILTITIPFIVIVSCFLFKRYGRQYFIFIPILVIYTVASFFMDSFILGAINLPL